MFWNEMNEGGRANFLNARRTESFLARVENGSWGVWSGKSIAGTWGQ